MPEVFILPIRAGKSNDRTMPDNTVNPKTRKLHEAVAAFCGKPAPVDSQSIAIIAEKLIGLLAARWEHLCDAANDEDNNGKISVSIALRLDLTSKAPTGAIDLGYTPQKVKDSTVFHVDDPDQRQISFDGGAANAPAASPPARRRRSAPTPAATA